jgi:hypothetical protein
MPLGQVKTKAEILAACKAQAEAARTVCNDAALDAYKKRQDVIEREYQYGAGVYPPGYRNASENRLICYAGCPYGCPNPSGYPDASELARGIAACEACNEQYRKEASDSESKHFSDTLANQTQLSNDQKVCDAEYEKNLNACINSKVGVIPSSPTTAPIVPVPTGPIRLDVPRDLRGYPLNPADYRYERLYETIRTIS